MTQIQLSPDTYKQAQKCIHCGLCLPTCPTYLDNGLEGDSPRGRIIYMKAMADGTMQPSAQVLQHLDLCLDCRACETACPSGVEYHKLIEETRAELSPKKKKSFNTRIVEFITRNVMTHPFLMKAALVPARILQKLGLWKFLPSLPGALGKMQNMLPDAGPIWPAKLEAKYAARGEKKMTVGFFSGCVGSVLYNDVNRKAIELLQSFGCDVVVPRSQNCCGAIHHHGGDPKIAAAFARNNIGAFRECERVVNTIAGCGAMLREYGRLLRHDSNFAQRAGEFDESGRDICELIAELNPPSPDHHVQITATYHDACHLAHAQSIRSQPRKLLEMIPGLKLIPLPESEICCGAAGTYNLMQPEMSHNLGLRKIENIRATGATACITGNVGCAMQIESEARAAGLEIKVYHPVELLHRAYFGVP